MYEPKTFKNKHDQEIVRFTVRIPKRNYEMILAKLEKSIINKSMNNWILEQILKGLV